MIKHTLPFLLTTLTLLITASLTSPTQAAAQSSWLAQADPTTSPTATDSTTQRLRERIDKIVEEKRDQVKGVLSELSETKRAFIAEVQRISAESITVRNPRGTFILPLDDKLTFTQDNETITIEEVAVGDWALVIGANQDGTFKAENIIISSASLRPEPKYIALGSISSINRNRTQVTFMPRSGEEEITLNLLRNTVYQDLNGAPITRDALTEDMNCLVVATIDDDDRDVTTIRVLTEIE